MQASDDRLGRIESAERFTLTITIEGSDGDGLMRVVSALHRRQIDIRQADYRRAAATSRMEVVVDATATRVRTAALTLENIADVTACEVTGSDTEQCEAEAPAIVWMRDGRRRPDRADRRRAG